MQNCDLARQQLLACNLPGSKLTARNPPPPPPALVAAPTCASRPVKQQQACINAWVKAQINKAAPKKAQARLVPQSMLGCHGVGAQQAAPGGPAPAPQPCRCTALRPRLQVAACSLACANAYVDKRQAAAASECAKAKSRALTRKSVKSTETNTLKYIDPYPGWTNPYGMNREWTFRCCQVERTELGVVDCRDGTFWTPLTAHEFYTMLSSQLPQP